MAHMLNRRFLLDHPAHLIALGFGAGLSRFAPGTVGTLWAWAAFLLLKEKCSYIHELVVSMRLGQYSSMRNSK